jgi:hypothetical protein
MMDSGQELGYIAGRWKDRCGRGKCQQIFTSMEQKQMRSDESCCKDVIEVYEKYGEDSKYCKYIATDDIPRSACMNR